MNKELKHLTSILETITLKYSLLHPIHNFVICVRGSFDSTFAWMTSEMGYAIAWQNTTILVPFQYHESNSKVSWISRLSDRW
jgi:hypothetical protein